MVRRTSECLTSILEGMSQNVNLYWRGVVGQSCKCGTVTVDAVQSKDGIQDNTLKQDSSSKGFREKVSQTVDVFFQESVHLSDFSRVSGVQSLQFHEAPLTLCRKRKVS